MGSTKEKDSGIGAGKVTDFADTRKKKKGIHYFVRKLGCVRVENDGVLEKPDVRGSFNLEASGGGKDRAPEHLIVMVSGIIGSAQNWRYAAKKLVKAYPNDVLVHCSESNTSTLTFDGIDIMGRRLADEVILVVNRHPSLRKISFVGHSLGGLVARYAVAELYRPDSVRNLGKENRDGAGDGLDRSFSDELAVGKVAGLQPVNFITSATPHLGSKGHKQVPIFCGLPPLEKGASHVSGLLGSTGQHLFLKDRENGKSPLVLRMSKDADDLKFISALQSFKRRVAYANARYDNLVGWSSSSLRRPSELPKRRELSKHPKYPHIVVPSANVCKDPHEEASRKAKVSRSKTRKMEEDMIAGLTRLTWERVDVNFRGSIQKLLAHSTIQVKTYWMHSQGADVIQHMIDNFQL